MAAVVVRTLGTNNGTAPPPPLVLDEAVVSLPPVPGVEGNATAATIAVSYPRKGSTHTTRAGEVQIASGVVCLG